MLKASGNLNDLNAIADISGPRIRKADRSQRIRNQHVGTMILGSDGYVCDTPRVQGVGQLRPMADTSAEPWIRRF
jgi:hypothetical protein